MALKDQVVELVLRARNMLSRDTDAAAASVESLAGNAEGLQEKLRALEDQGSLIKQFDAASKAVDRTGAAYDRARTRLDKLKVRIDKTESLTRAQAREFTAASQAVSNASESFNVASKAVENTGEAYESAKSRLDQLKARLSDTGPLTEAQAREFNEASEAVERASQAFDDASRAVNVTGSSYERAQAKLEKLKDKIGNTEALTEAQKREFTAASRAVDRASQAYEEAQGTLGQLSTEAEKAGVDVTNLSEAKRENAKQATAAKRALEDYNDELGEGGGKLRALGKSLASGAKSLAKWASAAAAAGAALAATALTRITTQQADLARQTLASAEAFGVSTRSLQEWQYAAEQVGIGGEKTADILKDVSEKIGDAFATGGGEAAEVIERLNLNIDELVRLEPDQQILKIAQQLDGMPKAEQIQVLESLASDASLLLPLLADNAARLRELAAAAEARGDILTEEELQRLADFDAAFERVKTAISGVFKQIAVNLAPAFQTLADKVDAALGSQPELIDKISTKIGALVTRVTELASQWATSTGSMARSFEPLAGTLEGTRQLFLVLVNAVKTVGATVGEVVARANYDFKNLQVGITKAMERIGLATEAQVVAAETVRDAAAAAVRDLDAQADQYAAKMREAGGAATEAFTRARDAARVTTAAVNETVGTIEDLSDIDLKPMAQQVEAAGEKAKSAADSLTELSEQIAGLGTRAAAQQLLTELTQQFDSGALTAEEYSEALRLLNQQLSDLGAGSAEQLTQTDEAAQRAAEGVREIGDAAEESAQRGGGAFAILNGAIDGYLQQMDALGARARTRFIELASGVRQTTSETDEFGSRIGELEQRLRDLRDQGLRTFDATGIQGALQDLGKAAAQTEIELLQQRHAMDELQQSYEQGAISADQYIARAQHMVQWSDLLDDQDLDNLRAGIEAATRAMDALGESSRNTLNSLQDEFDRLQGNTDAIRERAYRERVQDLEDQLEQARYFRNEQAIQDLEESLRLAKEINRLESASSSSSAPANRQPSSPGFTPSATSTSSRTVDVNINFAGIQYGTVDDLTEQQADQLVSVLERMSLNTPRLN